MKKNIFLLALGLLCISTVSYSQDIPARVMAIEQANETFKKELAALKNRVNALAQENENLKTEVVPIGTVQAYAGDKIPTGWKLCDGSELNQSDHPQLFNAIGKAWGGSSTKFKLPDLQGRFLRGVAGPSNTDPDKADRTALFSGGNKGNQVGSYQYDEFKLHKHAIRTTDFNPGEPAPAQGYPRLGHKAFCTTDRNAKTVDGNSGELIIETGGSETRPANAYVHFIIKADH